MAQSLLDAKEQAYQGGVELRQLEVELQRASEEDASLKANLLYPFLRVQNGWTPAPPGGTCSSYKTHLEPVARG